LPCITLAKPPKSSFFSGCFFKEWEINNVTAFIDCQIIFHKNNHALCMDLMQFNSIQYRYVLFFVSLSKQVFKKGKRHV